MRAAKDSEDIHSIMSRFSQWSGGKTRNGNVPLRPEDGLREISCEEAIRQLRKQRGQRAVSLATPSDTQAVVAVAEPKKPATETARAAHNIEPHLPTDALLPAMRPKVASVKKPPTKSQEMAMKARPAEPAKSKKQKVVAAKAAAARSSRREPAKPAKSPDFRAVLADSVNATRGSHDESRVQRPIPSPIPSPIQSPARRPERRQRVSVRLSDAEEKLLQQSAARAGVTVSEYLRMRALDEVRGKASSRPDFLAPAGPSTQDQHAAPAPHTARGGLGDWIMLLRQRFLSSPTRFAERA